MTLHLKAETEDAGTRLDAFVASRANGLTRSQAARYIEEGRVSVDGKPAAKSCRITGGEAVTVDVPEVRDTALTAQDIPLDVVYEDADVIVVNKPAGLVVHPAPGHPDGTLVNALLHHCGPSLSGIGGGIYYLAGTGQYVLEKSILGMGFNGIPVALLASSNPIGTIFSALFISYIQVGGAAMQPAYSSETIDIVIAVIIYLAAFALLMRGVIAKAVSGRKEKGGAAK